ncbi:MAG: PRC-barrel domain-containing protein [Paracoccaceae bacterium]
MKKLLLSTAFLAVTGAAGYAQDATATFRAEADPMEIHASDFIGKNVYTSEANIEGDAFNGVQDDWEDIGEINDVILSRDGQVAAVLIDVGGFLGMGERQIAVDMSSVRFVADDATPEDLSDYFLVVNAPRATLEEAPEYTWERDAEMTANKADDATADTAATDTAAADAGASDATADTAATDTAAADPTATPIARDGYVAAEQTDLTAEMLTGAPAYDANDEWIGEVSELVLADDGSVSEAVVDVGGWLGIGEKPVALKLDDVEILRTADGGDLRVYLSQTKEELEAMPTYEN